jgi:hypothetical protein
MGSGPSQMANLGGWAPCFSLVNLVIPRCVSLPQNGRPPGPNLQHRHNLTDIPWRNAHILLEIFQGAVPFTRLTCPQKMIYKFDSNCCFMMFKSSKNRMFTAVHLCYHTISVSYVHGLSPSNKHIPKNKIM